MYLAHLTKNRTREEEKIYLRMENEFRIVNKLNTG